MGTFLPNHFPERQVPDTGDVSLAMALAVRASAATPALLAVVAILKNNVQLLGPGTSPGTTVSLTSAPFVLQPDVVTGSPTVHVTGSLTVTGTPGQTVQFGLIRDLGGTPVVLTTQRSEIGATTVDQTTATLEFLDTVDTVDANTGVPSPLPEVNTHTYLIIALAASALTIPVDPSLIMEQMLGGSSSTTPTPPLAPVNLGTASQFAALSSVGITNVPTSSVTGDIGTAASYASLTGWTLIPTVPGGGNTLATSSEVVGNVYAFDYSAPTPAKMTLANNDMLAAYTDASGRTPGTTNAFVGHLGGQTLVPGIYKWTTAIEVGAAPAGTLTLNGNGVYILIGTSTLDIHANIVLTGGALAQNVFWAIAGAVTIYPAVTVFGELLGQTSIAMQAGATIHGRLLGQTGITLISNTIVETR